MVLTGDLPPFDFVTANGQAAGFNIALLAEISKRLNINVEFIMSDAGSRAAMLTSERADIVFWMRSNDAYKPDGTLLIVQSDAPDGMLLTTPYYSGGMTLVALKEAE